MRCCCRYVRHMFRTYRAFKVLHCTLVCDNHHLLTLARVIKAWRTHYETLLLAKFNYYSDFFVKGRITQRCCPSFCPSDYRSRPGPQVHNGCHRNFKPAGNIKRVTDNPILRQKFGQRSHELVEVSNRSDWTATVDRQLLWTC